MSGSAPSRFSGDRPRSSTPRLYHSTHDFHASIISDPLTAVATLIQDDNHLRCPYTSRTTPPSPQRSLRNTHSLPVIRVNYDMLNPNVHLNATQSRSRERSRALMECNRTQYISKNVGTDPANGLDQASRHSMTRSSSEGPNQDDARPERDSPRRSIASIGSNIPSSIQDTAGSGQAVLCKTLTNHEDQYLDLWRSLAASINFPGSHIDSRPIPGTRHFERVALRPSNQLAFGEFPFTSVLPSTASHSAHKQLRNTNVCSTADKLWIQRRRLHRAVEAAEQLPAILQHGNPLVRHHETKS